MQAFLFNNHTSHTIIAKNRATKCSKSSIMHGFLSSAPKNKRIEYSLPYFIGCISLTFSGYTLKPVAKGGRSGRTPPPALKAHFSANCSSVNIVRL